MGIHNSLRYYYYWILFVLNFKFQIDTITLFIEIIINAIIILIFLLALIHFIFNYFILHFFILNLFIQ